MPALTLVRRPNCYGHLRDNDSEPIFDLHFFSKYASSTMIPMRYVVTGGAGFIGSNTVDELVRRGHSVVVLDDLSAGKEENLAEVRNKITFIKGSITDIEAVRKAMQEADYVIHLAP